ncbi:UNVERIFIED_CONTAM: hypothetical protein O8I53_08440 [Campylobacter lari]
MQTNNLFLNIFHTTKIFNSISKNYQPFKKHTSIIKTFAIILYLLISFILILAPLMVIVYNKINHKIETPILIKPGDNISDPTLVLFNQTFTSIILTLANLIVLTYIIYLVYANIKLKKDLENYVLNQESKIKENAVLNNYSTYTSFKLYNLLYFTFNIILVVLSIISF